MTLDPFVPFSKRAVTLHTCNVPRVRVRAYRVHPCMWTAFQEYQLQMGEWLYRRDKEKKAQPTPPGELIEDCEMDVGGCDKEQPYRQDCIVTTRLLLDHYFQARTRRTGEVPLTGL